jgi:hypothetical protein
MAEVDQGNMKDSVIGVLNYVASSPFRLLVVVVLMVLCFTGYFIYQNQGFLLQAYQKRRDLPKMDSGKYEDVAKMLIKQTGANLVVIFEVDPILNQRKLARIFSKDGRVKDFDGDVTPLFSGNEANNRGAIALMAGEVPCGDYTKPQSLIGIFYIQNGVTYACRVSVPSNPNQFIGQITVTWEQKPAGGMEDFMRIAGDALLEVK